MQYLRKLNIFQVYRRLPCIVYKQTYLIPQQPFPTLSAKSGKEIALDPTKALNGKMEKAGKEDTAFQQQMQQYKSKYILPSSQAKTKTSIAIRLFLLEHGQQPSPLYDNKPNKSLVVGQIAKVYKSLSMQVRDSYDKKAEDIHNQMQKQKEEYDAKHKIPEVTKMTNIQYYKFQMKQLFKKKSFPKFSSLSKKEQKPFIKECKAINKQSKQALENFLAKHSLSLQEFTAITQICETTEKCVELLKKVKEIQKKKIDYFSKITDKDAEAPNFDKQKAVQEELKDRLNFLERLPETKLEVLAKMIGVKIESQQKENNAPSIQSKVEEILIPGVNTDNGKKVEQATIEIEEIKNKAAQNKEEIKAVPAQQRQEEKKLEPQSPVIQERQGVKPQQPSKKEKVVQTNESLDLSYRTSAQNEYSEVLQELKDEQFDDLNDLDGDAELHKIDDLLQKARKLKLSSHNIKS